MVRPIRLNGSAAIDTAGRPARLLASPIVLLAHCLACALKALVAASRGARFPDQKKGRKYSRLGNPTWSADKEVRLCDRCKRND
jgi:hypothetical protein